VWRCRTVAQWDVVRGLLLLCDAAADAAAAVAAAAFCVAALCLRVSPQRQIVTNAGGITAVQKCNSNIATAICNNKTVTLTRNIKTVTSTCNSKTVTSRAGSGCRVLGDVTCHACVWKRCAAGVGGVTCDV